MKIIVRNMEPRFFGPVEECAGEHKWSANREDAHVFEDVAVAERLQGQLAGRFETWLEDA